MRLLNRQGQDTLKDSKQLWLWAEENLPQKHQDRFAQLKLLDLNTSRAWAMKENLRRLWEQPTLTARRTTIWCIGSSGCGSPGSSRCGRWPRRCAPRCPRC